MNDEEQVLRLTWQKGEASYTPPVSQARTPASTERTPFMGPPVVRAGGWLVSAG